ncbi:hypothetical protein SAMN02583745_01945 [Thorsellia anophelis DSM 18579]|uniref:Transposase n=1 Tax=Thorsellia anophelis DSM 18579 TaxID=1123402 RepID=A0A1I0DDY5_9GAMM|nr:hypothetical protein [Thorsellia anophelis]SET30329.1 hypothetical protein SAMN02583745_01945 [Thorsellia anophelis DSM 18579]
MGEIPCALLDKGHLVVNQVGDMRDKLPKKIRDSWNDKRRVIESTICQLA